MSLVVHNAGAIETASLVWVLVELLDPLGEPDALCDEVSVAFAEVVPLLLVDGATVELAVVPVVVPVAVPSAAKLLVPVAMAPPAASAPTMPAMANWWRETFMFLPPGE
ncbi:hypothetical protein HJ588_10270 [Flexivirga sp. ID2601S]|uniref:Uncharacterized protein n=1 Tax=Flexivirga aerilata TaxID=1656889 RepID=A0A849AGS9_9MICO|nr:hypothetical protein [Flexivirga aerilata]NNG39655.1 hypothetical protein [Flexivirga aerilata]